MAESSEFQSTERFRSFSLAIDDVNAILSCRDIGTAVRVRRLPRGEVSAVFEVITDSGEDYILKVYLRGLTEGICEREINALRFLTKVNNPRVPVVLGCASTNDNPICFPYILMERLGNGDCDTAFAKCGTDAKFELIHECGLLLKALHQVEHPNAAEFSIREWVTAQESEFTSTLAQLKPSYFNANLVENCRSVWESKKEELLSAQGACFLHLDFSLGNIRTDKETLSIVGLVDFANSRIGPPIEDFRDLYIGLFLGQPSLSDWFWKGYGSSPSRTQETVLNLIALKRAASVIHAYEGPTSDDINLHTVKEILVRLSD